MAAITGVTGNVSLSGAVGLIKSWTANIAPAEIDITAFGNVGKSRAHGVLDITGNIVATMDNGSNPINTNWLVTGATGASLTLTAESGNTIVFNALIRSCDMSVDVNGSADVTYNYQLNATGTATAYTSLVTVTWT
jgi:hypothetical protein